MWVRMLEQESDRIWRWTQQYDCCHSTAPPRQVSRLLAPSLCHFWKAVP